MNLFDLVATLTLDDKAYTSGLQNASNTFQGVGKKVAGLAATYFGTKAIVNFAKETVNAGRQFDASMSQVAATMGYSVEEINKEGSEAQQTFQKLRDFAQEMGSTTAFSASQSAEALNYMALAGYDADTSMKMLPTVLNLAAAGGMELATASDMVTDAQSALGLTIDETTTMVDQMAKASSKSNTSVSQLGEAFLKIGATAANMKGGTQELATVLGVLADNGIKGAEGGTHLRNIMLSLQTAASDGAVDFGDFSVQLYEADGSMRNMVDVIKDMQNGMGDMTQASKDAIISGMFNKADLASVNALLATSGDRFDELYESIGDCTGAAEDMANVQLDNLEGDVTLFKSALEGLQIALSDKVTPVLRGFVKFGSDGLSKLTGLLKGEGNLTQQFTNMAKSIGLDTTKVKEQLEKFKQYFDQAKEKVGKIMGQLKEIFGTVLSVIVELWNKYGNDVVDFVGKTFNSILEIISGILEAIKVAWDFFGSFVMTYIDYVWKRVKIIVETAINAVKAIIHTVTSLIKGDWEGVWNGIKSFFGTILSGIWELALNKFNAIWEFIRGIVDKLKGIFNFEWSLPKLKLPHFNIVGEFSLVPPNVPKFSIDWYKKAYDSPLLFTQPTVIPTGNGLKGFGDGNGGELVIGMHKLKELVGHDGGYVQNITINAPKQLDASEIARQTKNASRDMILKLKVG